MTFDPDLDIQFSDDPEDANLGLAPGRPHNECVALAAAIADHQTARFLSNDDPDISRRFREHFNRTDFIAAAKEECEEAAEAAKRRTEFFEGCLIAAGIVEGVDYRPPVDRLRED